MGRVESHSTTGTETDSGFGGNGSFDSTGGVSVGVVRLSAEYGLDAAGGGRGEDSGARTTSGRLRREVLAMKLLEAQQKEKSMQEALEVTWASLGCLFVPAGVTEEQATTISI